MDVDRFFDSLGELAHLSIITDRYNNKLKQMKSVQKRNCGNCDHWMKSSCCPEKEFGQFKSAGTYPCKDFILAHSSEYLIRQFESELGEIQVELKQQ